MPLKVVIILMCLILPWYFCPESEVV